MTLNFIAPARDGLVIATDTRINFPHEDPTKSYFTDDHRKVHQINENFGYTFSGSRSFTGLHPTDEDKCTIFDPCSAVHAFNQRYKGSLPDPNYFQAVANFIASNFNNWARLVRPYSVPEQDYESCFEMVFFHFADPDHLVLMRILFQYTSPQAPELHWAFDGGVRAYRGEPFLKGAGDLWFKDQLQNTNPQFASLRRDPLYRKFFLGKPPNIEDTKSSDTIAVLKQMIGHTSKCSPLKCVSESCDVVFLDRINGWKWIQTVSPDPKY